MDCGLPIPEDATAVHGIGEIDVCGALDHFTVRRLVHQLCQYRDVVIYNAAFDSQYLDLSSANSVMCAMEAAQEFWQLDRWPRLAWCADQIGIEQPTPHSAVTDADVCRQVWQHIHADHDGAILADNG